MEWLVTGAIVAVVGAIIIVSVRSEKEEQRKATERAHLYNAAVDRERQALLSAPDRMTLTPLDPSNYDYRPVAKEKLIAVQENASRYELKISGYQTSGTSLSIPIFEGVRYEVGSGQIASKKSWQVTATGRLLITDKAVVFESPQMNERIEWEQIADAELI